MYVLVLDKAVPTDEYEQAISGELIDPEEIGVTFDDIGSVSLANHSLTAIKLPTDICSKSTAVN